MILKTTPRGSPGIDSSFMMQKISTKSDWITPNEGAKCRWGRLKLRFFRPVEKASVLEALPPKMCVHPSRWYASTTVRWRRKKRYHQRLLKVLLRLTRGSVTVCVIRITVGQYFNWYRASRGSLSDSSAFCQSTHAFILQFYYNVG